MVGVVWFIALFILGLFLLTIAVLIMEALDRWLNTDEKTVESKPFKKTVKGSKTNKR